MAATQGARWPWILWTTVVAVLVVAAATFGVVRVIASPPEATVTIDAPATLSLGGSVAPPVPTPRQGSFALATSLDGMISARAGTTPRPIGSVAKAMTALVVLTAYPLAPGAAGPPRTMTSADVALYRQALAGGGSTVPVRAGEVLTERDLLLALLLPSANNIAETLAVWVSGNRTAFIARLNATATALGMTHTHFADPSGVSPQTVSSAADLVLLARAALSNPALAQLVATRQATLPGGTILTNLDIMLAKQPGWLGIKTGWTSAAGGCLLFAARDAYAPDLVMTVWGAVLGQPAMKAPDPAHPELGAAFVAAQSAVVAAFRRYAAVDLGGLAPVVTGSVSTAWGDDTQVVVAAHPRDVVLVRAGATMRLTLTRVTPPVAPIGSGVTVARLTGVVDAKTSVTWQIVSQDAVPGPSVWWKLLHG